MGDTQEIPSLKPSIVTMTEDDEDERRMYQADILLSLFIIVDGKGFVSYLVFTAYFVLSETFCSTFWACHQVNEITTSRKFATCKVIKPNMLNMWIERNYSLYYLL